MPESPRSPLRSLAAHPVIAFVLTALGLGAGAAAGYTLPVTYTGEARLAVVSATNNAYTIPGYPLAARELASDYARWVQNRSSDGQWSPAGSTAVSASPIPDSAVIRIEVQAGSPAEAVNGADEVAQTLVSTVSQAQSRHDPQRAYEDYRRQAPAVAQARAAVQQAESAHSRALGAEHTAARVEAAARVLQQARVRLAELELRQNAAGDLYRRLYADAQGASTLQIISPGAQVGTPQRTTTTRFGVLGAALGCFLAMLIAVARDRRARRKAASSAAPAAAERGQDHPQGAVRTSRPARPVRADRDRVASR